MCGNSYIKCMENPLIFLIKCSFLFKSINIYFMATCILNSINISIRYLLCNKYFKKSIDN